MVLIRDLKTFYFYFDWPKDVEFIIKSNESLVENKIKNKFEQLLSKYKHGNDILEHRKQENE